MMDFIKIKNLYSSKDIVKKVKTDIIDYKRMYIKISKIHI